MTEPTQQAKDPYGKDLFHRNQTLGENLIHILSLQQDSFVIALNGSWGTGKTTFIEMWTEALQNAPKEEAVNYNVIMFNAWENDCFDVPLISLISEINIDDKGKKKEMLTQLRRVGLHLATKTLSSFVPWVDISADDFDPSKLSTNEEKKINDFFDTFAAEKRLLNDFKSQLGELATQESPILFIVDELDRCKPTYSIIFLERIKHLFDVPNVYFVLAIDKEQLGISIQSVYGNIDIDGYLRRFINLTIDLPEVKPAIYIKHLLKQPSFTKVLEHYKLDGHSYLKEFLPWFASMYNFSLRDIEVLLLHLRLAICTIPENIKTHLPEISTLLCLKTYDDKLYHNFCHAKIKADDIIKKNPKHEYIDESKEDRRQHKYQKNLFEAALIFLDPSDSVDSYLRIKRPSDDIANLLKKMQKQEELPEEPKKRLQKVYKHIEMIDKMYHI